MSILELQVVRIDSVLAGVDSNSRYKHLTVDVVMTPEQMKAALGEFLTHITDQQWHEWLLAYAPEYTDALAEKEAKQ